MKLETIYETLRNHYGDLGWWPAEAVQVDDRDIRFPDKRNPSLGERHFKP